MKVLRETHGEDNTVKFLIGLDDLQSVEALNMCDKELRLTYHSTVCVYRSMPRRMKNGWRLSPTQKLRSAGDEAAEACRSCQIKNQNPVHADTRHDDGR